MRHTVEPPNFYFRRRVGASLYPRPASLGNEVPGMSGERHHVAWSAPNGDVHVDRGVKLYDFDSIQGKFNCTSSSILQTDKTNHTYEIAVVLITP